MDDADVETAEMVLPCRDLGATLPFFVDDLGFRLEMISPADDPSVAVITGHGVRLRLGPGDETAAGAIRLRCRTPEAFGAARELTAPNGTRIVLVDADPPLVLPPLVPSLVIRRRSGEGGDGDPGIGRAGMWYRDLIPDRQGGLFIASHITIPEAGPVPDYVHHHAVRFQMIYCRRGWVRVVYENQGPSFVLEAGDSVLQPPGIRHRVLESSAGLEVIELSSPADHETFVDHDLALPTVIGRPERDFGGQRFVRHVAAEAPWVPWCRAGWDCRDLGIAAATGGLATARVLRFVGPATVPASAPMLCHDRELLFLFVLGGRVVLSHDGNPVLLESDDAVVVPAGMAFSVSEPTANLELLEIAVPAD